MLRPYRTNTSEQQPPPMKNKEDRKDQNRKHDVNVIVNEILAPFLWFSWNTSGECSVVTKGVFRSKTKCKCNEMSWLRAQFLYVPGYLHSCTSWVKGIYSTAIRILGELAFQSSWVNHRITCKIGSQYGSIIISDSTINIKNRPVQFICVQRYQS